jgi:hypothetical protein
MDNDNKNKNLEKNISGKSITTSFNDCAIPESIWIRRYSVWTMSWTGSLWKANAILYCVAVLFFGVYIYLRRLSKKP